MANKDSCEWYNPDAMGDEVDVNSTLIHKRRIEIGGIETRRKVNRTSAAGTTGNCLEKNVLLSGNICCEDVDGRKMRTDQSGRYDRQLRIWGDVGQKKLEEAHVCVINASALGTESLKNLVLPGIGAFTLIDGKKSTGRDLGSNFFITEEQVKKGVNRAEAAAMLLRELNDAVEGSYVAEDISEILEQTEDIHQFFSKYSLVVATNLPHGPVLDRIAESCYDVQVPLLLCRVHGLIGQLRLITPEHCVENSRAGTEAKIFENLRLSDPFQELIEFSASFDLDGLDDTRHGHVPYVIILVQALMQWRRKNKRDSVSSREEMNEIREIIRQWRRSPKEENFDEALKKTFLVRATADGAPPFPFKVDIAEKVKQCKGKPNETFWLMAAALEKFVETEGRMPVNSELPDMVADTESYVALQRVYRAKAMEHCSMVMELADSIAREHGLETPSEGEVNVYCSNAASLDLLTTRSVKEEMTSASASLTSALQEEQSSAFFYIFMRALDRLSVQHLDTKVTSEQKNLMHMRAESRRVMSELGMPADALKLWDEGLMEFMRHEGSEIHTIASFLGGVVAQECVKILTRQFVPIKDTVIFNGIQSSTVVLEL